MPEDARAARVDHPFPATHLAPMRRHLVVFIILAAASSRAEAQVDYYARLGISGSTRLVRDVIFQPIVTTPGLAPTLFLGFTIPLAPRYNIGVEGGVARGSLAGATEDASGQSGDDVDLGGLTTLTGIANLEGPVAPHLRWRFGVGAIRYSPGESAGAFGGGGATRWLVGGGLDFRRGALESWDLMLSARYDFHRFTTDELRARGFTRNQAVQRGSLSIGLARRQS